MTLPPARPDHDPSGIPALFRWHRIHTTITSLWQDTRGAQSGRGHLSAHAADAIPHIWADFVENPGPESAAVGVLVGLLLEAEGPEPDIVRIRKFVDTHLSELFPLLACDVRGESAAYVLSHYGDRAEAILQGAAQEAGPDSPWIPALRQVFALQDDPDWARASVSYLGAMAASAIPPDPLVLARETLVCPSCRGELQFDADNATVGCPVCHHPIQFADDVLDMIGDAEPRSAEFVEKLAERYESLTRPRFVRVMAKDRDRQLTPEREEDYLRQFLHTAEGPVLDLACGAGGWTERVVRQVGMGRVIAVDYALPMVQACTRRIPHLIGIRGDAGALPIRSGILAGANCSDALQALPDPATAIAEVARCLRPGAPFTALTFVEGDGLYRYFQHRTPIHNRHVFAPTELRSMIENAGLTLTDWTQTGLAVFFTATKPEG
jgi:ubiquinone/menaquinone biosynthesis C-methylase UbiE